MAVYVYLRSRANADGYCWPSYQTIAEAVGLHRRRVIDIMRALLTTDLVRVAEYKGRRAYHVPLYLEHQPTLFEDLDLDSDCGAGATDCTALVQQTAPPGALDCTTPVQQTAPPGAVECTQSILNNLDSENYNQRTISSELSRRWDAPEPPLGPYHVLWRVEQETRCLVITSDLKTELHHVKTMLQNYTEDDIVELWLQELKRNPTFALPRFLVRKIGPWAAGGRKSCPRDKAMADIYKSIKEALE